VAVYQCQEEGKDHLLRPAGNPLPNAAQDTILCLCGKDMLLAHSTWCPLGSPGPFLQNWFPAG